MKKSYYQNKIFVSKFQIKKPLSLGAINILKSAEIIQNLFGLKLCWPALPAGRPNRPLMSQQKCSWLLRVSPLNPLGGRCRLRATAALTRRWSGEFPRNLRSAHHTQHRGHFRNWPKNGQTVFQIENKKIHDEIQKFIRIEKITAKEFEVPSDLMWPFWPIACDLLGPMGPFVIFCDLLWPF